MNAMDRILELPDEIERQIESGDWLAASGTDAERRRLLVSFLEANDVAHLSAHEQAYLREVLQRTRAVVAEVAQLKGELAASSRRLRAATHALRTYRQNEEPNTLTALRSPIS